MHIIDIEFLSGARKGRKLSLAESYVQLGTADESLVQFDPELDLDVEAKAANIERRKDQFWLVPLSGKLTWINGQWVKRPSPLCNGDVIALGMKSGPSIRVLFREQKGPALSKRSGMGQEKSIEPAAVLSTSPQRRSLLANEKQVMNHYFGKSLAQNAGAFTRMLWNLHTKVCKRHHRRYVIILGVVAVLFVAAVLFGVHKKHQLTKLTSKANRLFYTMKRTELRTKQIEKAIREHAAPEILALIRENHKSMVSMKKQYDEYIAELDLYKNMDSVEVDIHKMARIFGECETNIPKPFVDSIKTYILNWQSSDRFEDAIRRGQTKNYISIIVQDLLAEYLPPQFLYLALQESNLNVRMVGPATRFGYAKGMWQFIPATARKQGLRIGPLVEHRMFDPRDERHHFAKSTRVAARYISDLYSSEAQASGLLVMASYNWGLGRVRERIHEMPLNPKERNFWKLMVQHDIPEETRKYVFYIFSAAVIGENPRRYGFDLDNPIKGILAKIGHP